mmetsp:Transcript_58790/g.127820  ORF Transcript_58790/g.127820 Transcript_58790/m.127820 type:complete len:203 (+) Transcript_58790:60-668(+)
MGYISTQRHDTVQCLNHNLVTTLGSTCSFESLHLFLELGDELLRFGEHLLLLLELGVGPRQLPPHRLQLRLGVRLGRLRLQVLERRHGFVELPTPILQPLDLGVGVFEFGLCRPLALFRCIALRLHSCQVLVKPSHTRFGHVQLCLHLCDDRGVCRIGGRLDAQPTRLSRDPTCKSESLDPVISFFLGTHGDAHGDLPLLVL